MHVLFSGRVQGVGFRYAVASIAERFAGVTGWVRNLEDGRVELLCEGARPDLEAFLAGIREAMARYIRKAETSWEGATGEFDRFRITY